MKLISLNKNVLFLFLFCLFFGVFFCFFFMCPLFRFSHIIVKQSCHFFFLSILTKILGTEATIGHIRLVCNMYIYWYMYKIAIVENRPKIRIPSSLCPVDPRAYGTPTLFFGGGVTLINYPSMQLLWQNGNETMFRPKHVSWMENSQRWQD